MSIVYNQDSRFGRKLITSENGQVRCVSRIGSKRIVQDIAHADLQPEYTRLHQRFLNYTFRVLCIGFSWGLVAYSLIEGLLFFDKIAGGPVFSIWGIEFGAMFVGVILWRASAGLHMTELVLFNDHTGKPVLEIIKCRDAEQDFEDFVAQLSSEIAATAQKS